MDEHLKHFWGEAFLSYTMTSLSRQLVEFETQQLRLGLDRITSGWPCSLSSLTDSLIGRIQFRANTSGPEDWAGQFDGLTLLYPLLHLKLIPHAKTDDPRMWTVIHALYLIHSILEDRFLDQQVKHDAALHLYDKFLLLHAENLSREMSHAPSPWWRRLHHDYAREQLTPQSSLERDGEDWPKLRSRLETGACHRAALGFMATGSMLHAHGTSDATMENVFGAFAALVIGLQWCDDFEDWLEDYETNRPNLMLARMRFGLGLRQTGQKALSPAEVRNLLVTTNAPRYAMRRAASLFQEAADRYRALGIVAISDLILQKAANALQCETMHAEAISNELVSGFEDLFQTRAAHLEGMPA